MILLYVANLPLTMGGRRYRCLHDKTLVPICRNGKHLGSLLYYQTFEIIAKDHSCIGGFCNTILEERDHVLWTVGQK